MGVTLHDVEYVASLARLQFTEVEKEKFTHQLNAILSYIEKLNEVDTTHVEPLSHVITVENVFRDDIVRSSFPREEMLKNAPDATDSFFKVPRVIGDR
jgi:aspartyl-tRNA(Asn)/glutamyl-tRNA(Gln) amidotransferase subunit C